jgi:hypothetical protein
MYDAGLGVAKNDDVAKENLSNLYSLLRGPLGVEDAELYRKDLHLGIENAKNMLQQCKFVNPDNFNCQYYYTIETVDNANRSYEELDKLYLTHPQDVVTAIINTLFE